MGERSIDEVKSDISGALVVESAITASVRDEYRDWLQAVLGEVEGTWIEAGGPAKPALSADAAPRRG